MVRSHPLQPFSERKAMSIKQVIVMRKDLNMRKGKMVAQGSHASVGAILLDRFFSFDGDKNLETEDLLSIPMDEELRQWIEGSFVKICVSVDSEQELDDIHQRALAANLRCCLITDNGTTEFNNVPTKTCLAIGPCESEKIDLITDQLKLL